MLPASGCSKPAIRRKQVVLPEPEGPSMAKNSPSAISRVTPSTARTLPKRREVLTNLTAAGMEFAPSRARPAPKGTGRLLVDELLAEDGDVVLCPLRVRYAGPLFLAFRRRRAPEPDLIEIVEAVGSAASVGEERIALAG